MRRWEDVRAEIFTGRETEIRAAQDQLEARQAEHEQQVLDSLED